MKVFIINAEKDVARKEFMEQQLSSLKDVDYEFVKAIMGSDIDPVIREDLSKKIKNSHPEINWEILNGEIGCYLSHLAIYEKICVDKCQDEWFVILEDDAQLTSEFISILTDFRLKNKIVKSNYELIVLGFDAGKNLKYSAPSNRYSHSIKKITKGINIGYPKYNHYGSFAYMITRSSARKLLKHGTENPSLSDYMIYESPNSSIELGILNKPIVFPNFNFDSNIRENHSFLSKELNITEIEKVSLKQKISELFRKPKYEYLK